MPRQVIITIDTQGNATTEAKGYAGSDCLKATKGIRKALGLVKSDRKTREFSQTQQQQNRLGQR